MKTIEISEATGKLQDYAKAANKGVLIITRRGKPVAAVVGVDEYDYESLSLSTNPKFIEIIARSRARLEEEGGISAADMRKRLGLSAASAGKRTRAAGSATKRALRPRVATGSARPT